MAIDSNLWKMYLFKFLVNLEFFGAIAVPYFTDWIHINYTQIFMLQAWFMVWIFLLEIPTGVVADKYGRRWSILIGSALWAAGMFSYGVFTEYSLLLLAEFLCAAGHSFSSGADNAIVYDTLVKTKRKKDARTIFARLEASSTAGFVTGFIGGSLFGGSNLLPYPHLLPYTFFLTATGAGLSVLVALTMEEPMKINKRRTGFLKMGWEGFKHIFKHKKLRMFTFNYVVISATGFFIFWFYQPLARDAGIPLSYLGFIPAAFNILSAGLMMNLKAIESWLGLRKILVYTAVIPAGLYISLGLTSNFYVVLASIIGIACLINLRSPILKDFMNRCIDCEKRATVLSGVSMLLMITRAVLYPIVGLLADMSLSYTLIFLGLASFVLAFVSDIEAGHLV